jgi:hypothetical protein
MKNSIKHDKSVHLAHFSVVIRPVCTMWIMQNVCTLLHTYANCMQTGLIFYLLAYALMCLGFAGSTWRTSVVGKDPCWLLPGASTGREAGRPRVVYLVEGTDTSQDDSFFAWWCQSWPIQWLRRPGQSNRDLMQNNNTPNAHFMHTIYKLYAHYVQTMWNLWLGRCLSSAFNEFSRCSLLTTMCEKPARIVWDPHCPAGPLLRLPVFGQVVHDTARDPPQPPKRRVDRAVLGDRQRCSPLTKTYGKSAGMVWGRWDHFCDIWFLSVT